MEFNKAGDCKHQAPPSTEHKHNGWELIYSSDGTTQPVQELHTATQCSGQESIWLCSVFWALAIHDQQDKQHKGQELIFDSATLAAARQDKTRQGKPPAQRVGINSVEGAVAVVAMATTPEDTAHNNQPEASTWRDPRAWRKEPGIWPGVAAPVGTLELVGGWEERRSRNWRPAVHRNPHW